MKIFKYIEIQIESGFCPHERDGINYPIDDQSDIRGKQMNDIF
jgi:hypothetical protein